MRPNALKALTWATVAAAVASALWLSIIEAELGAVWRVTVAPSAPRSALPAAGTPGPRGRARERHVGQQQRATHQIFHRV